LHLAAVSSDDVLYDLGCGDGRVCLEALVQHQCRHCVGVEIELDLVNRFQELIAKLPTTHVRDNVLLPSLLQQSSTTPTTAPRIFAVHADLRDVLSALLKQLGANKSPKEQIPEATITKPPPLQKLPIPTVIFMYLLPESVAQLEPSLISLLQQIPHLRIVMNTWGLTTLPASQTVQVWEDDSIGVSSQVLIYDQSSLNNGEHIQT
jgi:hypothetical protein